MAPPAPVEKRVNLACVPPIPQPGQARRRRTAAGDAAAARGTLQQAVQQLQGSVDASHPWLADAQARLAALDPAPATAAGAGSAASR